MPPVSSDYDLNLATGNRTDFCHSDDDQGYVPGVVDRTHASPAEDLGLNPIPEIIAYDETLYDYTDDFLRKGNKAVGPEMNPMGQVKNHVNKEKKNDDKPPLTWVTDTGVNRSSWNTEPPGSQKQIDHKVVGSITGCNEYFF